MGLKKRSSTKTKMQNKFMQYALDIAKIGGIKGEVPVGAVVVNSHKNEIIAANHNLTITNKNPLAHAEMIVIKEASKILQDTHLSFCDLYVTLEPCPMCAYAISLAKIRRLYFAASDPKSGGVDNGPNIFNCSSAHHKPEIYSLIMEKESKLLLQEFFKNLRKNLK